VSVINGVLAIIWASTFPPTKRRTTRCAKGRCRGRSTLASRRCITRNKFGAHEIDRELSTAPSVCL
jgi:hypothetical protein